MCSAWPPLQGGCQLRKTDRPQPRTPDACSQPTPPATGDSGECTWEERDTERGLGEDTLCGDLMSEGYGSEPVGPGVSPDPPLASCSPPSSQDLGDQCASMLVTWPVLPSFCSLTSLGQGHSPKQTLAFPRPPHTASVFTPDGRQLWTSAQSTAHLQGVPPGQAPERAQLCFAYRGALTSSQAC